jgi:hypothetical protein
MKEMRSQVTQYIRETFILNFLIRYQGKPCILQVFQSPIEKSTDLQRIAYWVPCTLVDSTDIRYNQEIVTLPDQGSGDTLFSFAVGPEEACVIQIKNAKSVYTRIEYLSRSYVLRSRIDYVVEPLEQGQTYSRMITFKNKECILEPLQDILYSMDWPEPVRCPIQWTGTEKVIGVE